MSFLNPFVEEMQHLESDIYVNSVLYKVRISCVIADAHQLAVFLKVLTAQFIAPVTLYLKENGIEELFTRKPRPWNKNFLRLFFF
jgi:hypothetical protein